MPILNTSELAIKLAIKYLFLIKKLLGMLSTSPSLVDIASSTRTSTVSSSASSPSRSSSRLSVLWRVSPRDERHSKSGSQIVTPKGSVSEMSLSLSSLNTAASSTDLLTQLSSRVESTQEIIQMMQRDGTLLSAIEAAAVLEKQIQIVEMQEQKLVVLERNIESMPSILENLQKKRLESFYALHNSAEIERDLLEDCVLKNIKEYKGFLASYQQSLLEYDRAKHHLLAHQALLYFNRFEYEVRAALLPLNTKISDESKITIHLVNQTFLIGEAHFAAWIKVSEKDVLIDGVMHAEKVDKSGYIKMHRFLTNEEISKMCSEDLLKIFPPGLVPLIIQRIKV